MAACAPATPTAAPIFDHVDYATYKTVLQEDVKNWSYMKFPHIKTLGADRGLVPRRAAGPGTGLRFHVDTARRGRTPHLPQRRGGKPAHGALMYHWARMIEMLHAAEMARELLDDSDIIGDGPDGGQGAAAARKRSA